MPVIAIFENQSGGLPDLKRQFRRNHPIGEAADTVGPEITASHDTNPDAHYTLAPLTSPLLAGGQASSRRCRIIMPGARNCLKNCGGSLLYTLTMFGPRAEAKRPFRSTAALWYRMIQRQIPEPFP